MGPRTGLDGCGKSQPPPGFDPRTVQPVASRHTTCIKGREIVKQSVAINMSRKTKVTLDHGSPACGPAACVMPPAATFLHGVHTIKITQYCRQFGTSLTVMFPRVACELAYNNGTGLLL